MKARQVRVVLALAGSLILLAATVSRVIGGTAQGNVAPAGPGVRTASSQMPLKDIRAARSRMALRDLGELQTQLAFRPILPKQLPSGWIYERVMWGPGPGGVVDGFGLYLAGPDHPWGHFVIHMDEGRVHVGPGVKPVPIDEFAQFEHPEVLSNGTWQVMQQQHEPWKGMSIYMIRWGDLYIQVEGMYVPGDTLRDFVASLA